MRNKISFSSIKKHSFEKITEKFKFHKEKPASKC